MFDVLVIGGGPAGSAAAIRLARIGLRVRLCEKASFPRPKLCGGFLSPECLADLEDLEVLNEVRTSGAFPVRRIVVSSPQGAAADALLPSPGLSLSRRTLDSILLNRARAVGVDVQEQTDGFAQTTEASWKVVATGRAAQKTQKQGASYYGVQAFFENVSGVTDQVELDMVPGGYVGLVQQDEARVNLCALTTQRVFQEAGPNIDTILMAWTRQNPLLASRLQQARLVSAWQAVGPVQMGVRRLSESRRLYSGDAACVVDPFAGEGIAMGLKSAALIQRAFQQNRQPVEEFYAHAWRITFSSALRIDWGLRRLLSYRPLQNIFVAGLRLFPPLLTWLTEQTRPSPSFPHVISGNPGVFLGTSLDPRLRGGDDV